MPHKFGHKNHKPLGRMCKYCKKRFLPTGKYSIVCFPCKDKRVKEASNRRYNKK